MFRGVFDDATLQLYVNKIVREDDLLVGGLESSTCGYFLW